MDTPESPAATVRPADRLREGIVGTTIKTKAGVELVIVPALISPAEILSAVSGELLRYAELAQRTRDQFVLNQRGNKKAMNDSDWYDLVVLAIVNSYQVSEDEIAGLSWFDPTEDLFAIIGAVWGHGSVDKLRRRALALACAGLADVPLSAMETAALSDWAWNQKLAPQMREG